MPISTQVTVTDTRGIIAAAANSYQNIYLHNLGGGAIYIGGPNVTISNGYKLDNGDKLSIIIGDLEALYGVAAAGSHTVSVLAQK
tara:strand:- start:602 stop:856 length:255 start_codon:yes stop_codon:yes gene_type:complete